MTTVTRVVKEILYLSTHKKYTRARAARAARVRFARAGRVRAARGEILFAVSQILSFLVELS